MDVKKAIEDWDEWERGLHRRTAAYRENPENEWVDPFCLFEGLYFVGDRVVSSHLIDTGEGLLLIDTGFPHTAELLVKRIEYLGFRGEDIRWIVHTHEHFDHFGATPVLQKKYGCKTFLHHRGADVFRIHPHHTELQSSYSPDAALFIPDKEFSQGDEICLGNVVLKCIDAPGHSAGAATFLFTLGEGAAAVRVGLCGVNGNLPLHAGRLLKYGIDLSAREQYRSTIDNHRNWDVDITLDTHPRPQGVLDRRRQMLESPEGNPFIDRAAWNQTLDDYLRRFDVMLAEERERLF